MTSGEQNLHLMISYQWDSQKRMIKLRDELIRAGFDVWMDVDKMGRWTFKYGAKAYRPVRAC